MVTPEVRQKNLLDRVNPQQDMTRLCALILEEARTLTGADGGTLYLCQGEGREQQLDFAIIRNSSLDIKMGDVSGRPLEYPAIPLYIDDQPNYQHMASYAALTGKLLNIADVYQQKDFDFSGTQKFDQRLGYHTQSVLTLPLLTRSGELVAVLQLLNATNEHGETIPFAPSLEPLVQTLAQLAAIAVQQQHIMQDQQALLITLSGEPNTTQLLLRILQEAQNITHADGGTLYLLRDQNGSARLDFTLMHNHSLGIALGGDSAPIQAPPIELYLADGTPNHHHVASYAALTKEVVSIDNAYTNTEFDFSGTKSFDQLKNYRTISLLALPLLNHAHEVIGVLQLVNAKDPHTGETVPFSADTAPLIRALARYAAIALNNQLLVEEHKNLLDAFIKAIATAIDAKSPHTSGHCQRVPLLTELIAQAACEDQSTFADFELDADGWYELQVAAWLHDCGKLATPNSVLDKSTKLHCLNDRIYHVESRFAALRQQVEADYWQAMAQEPTAEKMHQQQRQARLNQLADDLSFLQTANQGGEFMHQDHQARVRSIAQQQWYDHQGKLQPLLSADEVENLCIERGTLTQAERDIINDHMRVTIEMLESLPFPRKLRRVPEYAGGHHEKMDGSGFPRGLTREQMSIPARMMAIADIFEALTAQDRPYKAPMKISQALSILQRMRDNNHIDPDLYTLFLEQRVWETYAHKALAPEQLDVVDPAAYR